ncbi:ABC transporter permease [Cupriavidus basilensis]
MALPLARELGPVVTKRLKFAGRAGTSLTAEIGLDGRPANSSRPAEMMVSVNPPRKARDVMAPCAFWAGVVAMPVLAAIFRCRRHILSGYVVGVQMIGVDAGAFGRRCPVVLLLLNGMRGYGNAEQG